MVRRRSYQTITTWHANRQGCENGQQASDRGGSGEADVRHRMDVVEFPCARCSRTREAWTLTRTVVRMINGFNSRCLHAITGEDYRTTATVPVYNLVLAVCKRRLRYLGQVLRLPAESIVRRSLVALVKRGAHYPEGSLFSDCEAGLLQLEALSLDRRANEERQ